MSRTTVAVIWVLVMVALIVGLDVSLFRNHFWPRLMINVGIVLVSGALFIRFFGVRK